MSFNNAFTAVTGATYTAAQYNTHTRDNFNAIWVYTTAGDIVYATGAATLARLGIGANDTTVLMPASGIPSWSHTPAIKGVLHAEASVFFTGEQTDGSGGYVNKTGATVNIVTTKTCTIRLSASGHIAHGNPGNRCVIRGSIGGVADPQDEDSLPWTTNGYYTPFGYVYKRAGVAAGTLACLLQFKGGGGLGYCNGGRIIAEAFVE